MPTDPKLKKSPSSLPQIQSDAPPPNPDGFLTELDHWGTKPNPASFEKLLEAYQDKFARALSQGYSVEDICRLAASFGIHIKPSTFRKYWQRLNAKPSLNTSSTTASSPTATTQISAHSSETTNTTANSAVKF